MSTSLQQVGFVIIGRNEGERLKEGLRSIVSLCEQSPVVYVDSGSDDDSVAFAKSLNVMVVELDLSTPFTAARARNAGFDQLMAEHGDLQYVQFLDGDCKLMPGWVEAAIEKLAANEDIGIASGRRQEKYPDASIYNELIDLEWNSPIGVALGVPGDMCVKVHAFKAIEGFSADMIAGEDFDFCLRALQAGFKTFRVDALMSQHDANIMHLSQWYKRIKRGGHAYANLYHRYKHTPEKYYFKQVRSALLWGALVPALIILLCFISPLASAVLLVGYLAFAAKSIKYQLDKGHGLRLSIIYGLLVFSGKFYEVLGIFQYAKNQFLSRKHVLIEYK